MDRAAAASLAANDGTSPRLDRGLGLRRAQAAILLMLAGRPLLPGWTVTRFWAGTTSRRRRAR